MLVKSFVEQNCVKKILEYCHGDIAAIEEKSSYSGGLTHVDSIRTLVTSREVIALARVLLGDRPLRFLSLTALTVEPGSRGMPKHVDYPHMYSDCPSDILCAQFVLALDGTSDGAAPTWVGNETNVVELEPGDLLAFAGTTPHGVLPNTSNRNRTNLLWSLGSVWVKPMSQALWSWTIDDVNVKDILM